MGNSGKALQLVLATGLAVTLAGCGGSDSPSRTTDTTTTTTTTTTDPTTGETTTINTSAAATLVNDNQPHSILILNPNGAAVLDEEWGYYRTKIVVEVQDADGHAVADGTPVYLSVMDTIIAEGTVDTITATTTLTDAGAAIGDSVTPTNLDEAYAIRNGIPRGIEVGDQLLLINNAKAEDKIRYVSATTASTVTTSSAYSNSYPQAAPAGSTEYVIGASLLGTQIAGVTVDETMAESPSPTPGVAVTRDGKAFFRLTYPADSARLNAGCNPYSDPRFEPVGSVRMYLTARTGDSLATINDTFCFAPIAGNQADLQIYGDTHTIPATTNAPGTVSTSLWVRDVGSAAGVPYKTIGYVVAAPFDVTITDTVTGSNSLTTNGSGWANVTIEYDNGVAGQKATITFFALTKTAELTLTVE